MDDNKCEINKCQLDIKQETEKSDKDALKEGNGEVDKPECMFVELPYEEDSTEAGMGSSANAEPSNSELNETEGKKDEATECLFIELPYEEKETENGKDMKEEATESALFIELPYEEENNPLTNPGSMESEKEQENDNKKETEGGATELGCIGLPIWVPSSGEEGIQSEKNASADVGTSEESDKEKVEVKTDTEPMVASESKDEIIELPFDENKPQLEQKPVRYVVKGRSLIPKKEDTETAPRNFVDAPDYGYIGLDGSFQVPF